MGEMRLKKLRWKSRRGMKELDVLFEAFFDRYQDDLRAGGWPQLEELLEMEDDVLFDWISGRNLPSHTALLTLIDALVHGK
jgi:antitoxin CptB